MTSFQFKCVDNSGALVVECIQVLKNGQLVVSVKSSNGKVKAKEIHRAIIVRTRKEKSYADGSYTRFGENGVVLIDNKDRFLGTRVFGPISKNLRHNTKLLLLNGNNIF